MLVRASANATGSSSFRLIFVIFILAPRSRQGCKVSIPCDDDDDDDDDDAPAELVRARDRFVQTS